MNNRFKHKKKTNQHYMKYAVITYAKIIMCIMIINIINNNIN